MIEDDAELGGEFDGVLSFDVVEVLGGVGPVAFVGGGEESDDGAARGGTA